MGDEWQHLRWNIKGRDLVYKFMFLNIHYLSQLSVNLDIIIGNNYLNSHYNDWD